MNIILLLSILFVFVLCGASADEKHAHKILDIFLTYKKHKHGNLVKGHEEVAFSASLIKEFTAKHKDIYNVVIFDNIKTNIGLHYSAHTGTFTAPVNGLYVFQWTIATAGDKNGDSLIMVNNIQRQQNLCDNRNSGAKFRSGSALIPLSLKKGDRVWIVTPTDGYVFGNNWSSFQGWLLSTL